MPLPRRALVTGSSGFVGSHLADRLAEEGYTVFGLDHVPPRHPLPPGVETIEADIRHRLAVEQIVLTVRPHVVFHLAAQTSVAVSMREPADDIETNVLGTVYLAQAAAAAGAERFVFVSTGGALYGEPAVVPVTEDLPPAPASVYGASKLAAERYLPLVAPSLAASVVRPGNIYGPRQDPHGEAGVVAIFTQRMLAGAPVTIFGDGSQQRDYVQVTDVTDAILRAAEADPATCLVGTGRPTSTMEIYDELAALTGYEARPVIAPERPGDIQRIALDSSRAAAAWGWRPRIGLTEGLRATVDWFRERSAESDRR